jgi:hypothetical protein
MWNLACLLLAALAALGVLGAPNSVLARTHVVIHKRPPVAAVQPAAAPLVIVPPIAVAFDLIRRTSCDPTIAVATGPNDPGFNSHPVGNYLVPAIYRSQCQAQPR